MRRALSIPRFVNRWFLMIAEPRIQRIMHFIVYLGLTVSGLSVLLAPPPQFEGVLGIALVYVFGGFITLGAVLAAVAVLPGVWWLERVGIISLATGMLIYLIITFALGASLAGSIFFACFTLIFVIRWMDIRLYQLAPKRG